MPRVRARGGVLTLASRPAGQLPLPAQVSPAVAGISRRLFDLGVVHMVATDAHHAGGRGTRLGDAVTAVGNAALARWLTVDVPGAIVHGGDLPARPPEVRRRRFWLRRGH